nr:glyoxylate/hydroxypyruvate reductase hpr3 [Quercus suber]
MATEDNEVEDHRPLVLIHHLPSFKLPLQDRLITHFRLFDSLASPEASSVRALICVGPTPVTADTLDHLPSLRLVVGSSAGLDHVDLAECRRRGIAVTSAGDANSENVADYAVALLLDVLIRVSAADRFVRSGLWPLLTYIVLWALGPVRLLV